MESFIRLVSYKVPQVTSQK